tara:strand:+ start:2307 stop:2564 length:258 start_codon:yes stop_codon:yes gene_type:complete
MNHLTRFEILHIINRGSNYKLLRSECIKIFKEKKMNVSVSKFIKLMNEGDGHIKGMATRDLTDKANDIIKQLRREWEINKIIGDG